MLVLLFSLAAILVIIAKYSKHHYFLLFTKPLPLVILISYALLNHFNFTSPYQVFLLAGLFFSLVGDLFLVYPKKFFKAGLFSFALAHVLYAISFSTITLSLNLIMIFGFTIYSGAMFTFLYKDIVGLRALVLIYTILISLMGYTGLNASLGEGNSLSLMIGILLFIISDSVLAINKFKRKFWIAEVIILSTYFTAQYLIFLQI